MGLGGVISNLLSLGAKLLPSVIASAQAASSSSSPAVDQNHQIEAELQKLMRILERIKATLYDAEQREITDLSVKLWLKELKGVVHDAEDVLGEYHYEVLRAQVEAREASPPASRKRKLIQVPYGMVDQIQQIRSRFDEIEKDRIALRLTEEDGPKRSNSELQIAPTSHIVVQSNIFGREREKEKLIKLLSSKCDVVSVVTIVGTGGIGKTTLAQLAYNDERIKQRFDKIGWICVSEDFNVVRLTKESIESITGKECGLTNLAALQKKFQEEISGKRVLFVLDDVWNDKKSLWNSFQTPFMSAAFVKILVTTRNSDVAQIMQTEPTFNLGYLSNEQCWQLFEHCAFDGIKHNKGQKFVEIGKQIINKCGMLPLAVKSIASLLRHETEEESWSDILESELWDSEASNEIFPSLQISYTRLPTYLKSCFLYCSMFPKDYCYDVEYLVKLWMYQGFIESRGNKTKEKIGFEYAQQLCQRSLFEREGRYEGNDLFGSKFKLHDIVHDLARSNSENGCYSIEVSKEPIFPNVVYHLYIADNVNLKDLIPSNKFTTLRTLITCSSVKNLFSTFDHSMPPRLRALEIRGSGDCKLELLSSIGILKHLRYLYISNMFFETLPECICSLYSLQNLTLMHSDFKELPTKIQNLISLEELIIDHSLNLAELPESLCQIKALRKLFISSCHRIKVLPNNIGNLVSLEELRTENCNGLHMLPESLCQLKALRKLSLIDCRQLEELPSDIGSLTKLQTLEISNNGVNYLPPSLSKLVGIQALKVELKCENIEWLKNFLDLRGTLYLCELNNVPNSMDLKCANLNSMHNLEHLILVWDVSYIRNIDGSVFHLSIKSGENILDNQSCFQLMDSLQPHPNLIKLEIEDYNGIIFPEWIGSLCKLKYLYIALCESLQFLKAESLPLQLEELKINGCRQLISVPGIQKLKSLVKLSINYCENLCSFMDQSLDGGSSLGLTHLASLRILKISNCSKLQVLGDELLPVEPCNNIEVYNCPGLREWCLQHRISYKEEMKRSNFDNTGPRYLAFFIRKNSKRALLAKLDDIIKGIDIKDDQKKEEKKDKPKPSPPKPPMYPWLPKPPMYPWPPQVTMVCFVCPCMTAWSNNYQSCSCRVERWPGRCGCRSGSGSRWGSGPRHGDHLQCTCEPSQQRNIGYESTPSISYESMPSIGYESTATVGYESMPNIGCESTPSIGYESTPNIGYKSMPSIGYELLGYESTSNISYESMPSIGYESMASIGYETKDTVGYESTPNIGCESRPSIGYESTPSIGYESTEPSCSIM